jgi:hypothetical protein
MEQNKAVGLNSAIEMIPKSDPNYDSLVNQFVAHSGAHDERSGEDETSCIPMFLSDEAKNRLMFYGRQDTAHGLLNTITLLRKVNRLILLVQVLIVAVVGSGLAVWYELATRH